MAKSKKGTKFRANVKKFVDADYKDKLNEQDLAYLEKFEREYYANELNKKDSIHREKLSEEDFKRAKKETYDATNAQNRDVYAIASTSSHYLKFIDDEGVYIEPADVKENGIDKIADPQYAFEVFLEQTIDEINMNKSRELKNILIEFGIESVKLGASLRRDKVNNALKRAKKTKGDK